MTRCAPSANSTPALRPRSGARRDAAIYREWVTNIGRREAFTRMAHIFCELIYRLRAVGRIEDHIAHIPITQAALDALGLSTVHVNRMLQELRRKGLIATSGARLHAQN